MSGLGGTPGNGSPGGSHHSAFNVYNDPTSSRTGNVVGPAGRRAASGASPVSATKIPSIGVCSEDSSGIPTRVGTGGVSTV